MDYIKLPITEKIENKIIFYLNIEEPFRGTSKLRGIQIFNKLTENVLNYRNLFNLKNL